eukprot:scaffold183086_cov32-Attheya_sp.AAC.1
MLLAIPGFGDRGSSSCAPHARNFNLTLLSLVWYRKLGWCNGRKLAITWVQGMTYSARYTIRAFGTKRETKGSN